VSLLVASASVLLAQFVAAAGAGGTLRSSDHARRGAPTLVLDDQTQWVVAPPGGSAGAAASAHFDVAISARDAPAGALVQVALYPRLRTRYDFERTVRDGPRGTPLATTAPTPLGALAPDPHSAGLSLALSIVQGTSSGSGSELGLACAGSTGSSTGGSTCTGVYPVAVELEQPDGAVVSHLTTFLTYVTGKSAHPLELAWVVPIAAPPAVAPHATSAARALRPLPRTLASALETLIAQVRAATSVPLTLDVAPETLQNLAAAGPGGREGVATVAAMSADPTTDEVLARPYVPIDLGALARAGEPTEIDAQMAAGTTVLHRLRVRTAVPSPWVETGPPGDGIARGLAQVHATQLVLPGSDLQPTPAITDSGTWVSTFSLRLGHGGPGTSVDAAESDTWLDRQFTALPGDPALAATQLLADLAMVHFERPDTLTARGMVALPPAGWTARPAFDRVLLDGLAQDPVVQPVTLSQFFATVGAAGTRQLAKGGRDPALSRAFARAVSRARVRLSEFDDAVSGSRALHVESALDHLLLASESDLLPPATRRAGVSSVERLLGAQLHLVRFAAGRSFTLTARTGWIPITIDSTAPYTVNGRLTFSGDKFLFSGGASRAVRLDHATNPTRIHVEARSSGELPLYVSFTSPDGRLVIARDIVEVRSTATSALGIGLSAAALAVLLAWWARTWLAGRRRRRVAATAGSAAGPATP